MDFVSITAAFTAKETSIQWNRQAQRIKFANLSHQGLYELRTLMHNFDNNIDDDDSHLDLQDTPKNVRARAWHFANDTRAVGYSELIFGGISKQARRAELDDKSSRIINHWQILCDEFFNRANWAPENEFSDTRLIDIDPSKPPQIFF